MAVLSRDTFDEFRKSDDQFKDETREFFKEQRVFNLDIVQRVAGLEKPVTTGTLSWLSAVVAAVVGAAKGLLGRA